MFLKVNARLCQVDNLIYLLFIFFILIKDKQSGSKPGDKDKKQLIKDQLKLLESALIKKKEKSMTK